MNLYLSDAQIPEFASLTAQQRRAVVRGARGMFSKEHPFAFLSTFIPSGIVGGIGVAVGIFFMRMFPQDSVYKLVPFVLCAGIFGGCGGFISTQLLFKRLRPYFHRFIEEHKLELSRVI